MSSCGSWALYHPQRGLRRFFCGSGNCPRPECQKRFWSARVRLISSLIAEYGLIRFFTLTLDPEFIGKENPWEYIHHPWSKMRKRLKRRSSEFRFVAILERHKHRDVPHIHGFTNLWLKQVEWSALWEKCKGGKVVWIEQVKDPNLSEYVSKEINVSQYVSKDTIKASYKVKIKYRTLWRSEGMKARFELDREPGWCIIKESVFKEDGSMTDYATKKGEWSNAETKFIWEDLEGTRSAPFTQSTEAGI